MTSLQENNFEWIIDRFDDIKILRYKVPGFEELSLRDKTMLYYLSQAAASGRDILFDQNFKYNLVLRRTLEKIYKNYKGDRECAQWLAFEKYLKKVWFASGVHHHYSMEKFTPEFSEDYFYEIFESIGLKKELLLAVMPVLFDNELFKTRVNQSAGVDMLQCSAMNYYEDVTQGEAEQFYNTLLKDAGDEPLSYGLNSKLTKQNGELKEIVWKVGGMYSDALEKVVYWLEKATALATGVQKEAMQALVDFYYSGDLADFDRYNILWLKDTESLIDFICSFTEVYGDPLGYKASWEALINIKNLEATWRAETLSKNAQWFEDNSPIEDKYKKTEVKGVTAKVITVTSLGGDCYPATPIGVNLPNADWIRARHGSKSVTIQNITDAYSESSKKSGFNEEFILDDNHRELVKKYGALSGNLHTDMHECLGHGSGQMAEGVTGSELKNYGSTLEEARADLFALYYIADPKLVELGIVENLDVAKAEYITYIMNGMMTQFTRIKLGDNVEQAHMRNRKLVSEWCFEQGKEDNVIEKVEREDKTYIVINDFERLRELFAKMLSLIQKTKSEGNYQVAKDLVETYAIKIDYELHKQVLERYKSLGVEPFSGFVNPVYTPIFEGDEIVDVEISYPTNYAEQMINYSENYSFLPDKN
ncbi:MAG: dihydrofolate reductase [Rikenellaceae bacterium]